MNIKNLPLISACIASMFAVTANAQVSIVDDVFPIPIADIESRYFGTSGSNAVSYTHLTLPTKA